MQNTRIKIQNDNFMERVCVIVFCVTVDHNKLFIIELSAPVLLSSFYCWTDFFNGVFIYDSVKKTLSVY